MSRWAPREMRRLAVRVTNDGDDSWKGLGGFMNKGGVRLLVRWRRGGPDGLILSEETHWAFLRLRAGATKRVAFDVEAPPGEGEAALVVSLTQVRVGPFSDRGRPPLVAGALVEGAASRPSWTIEGPADIASGGSARFSVVVDVADRGADTLYYRWRRTGGPVLLTEGGVPLTLEREGGIRAHVTVDARVVSGDYDLEFGIGGPDRTRVDSWSPPRRVLVR